MGHNRKLVIGSAALTMARNNAHEIAVGAEVRDELERVIIENNYLDKAPFKWIGLILRYGLKNDVKPSYQHINRRHGDLPVAIELDTHDLQHASREELKEIFTIATLRVLVDVGEKYGLPADVFCEMLKKKVESGLGRAKRPS